jgi:hypothetical protein
MKTGNYTRLLDLQDSSDKNQMSDIILSRNTLMRSSFDWVNKLENKIQLLKDNKCLVFGYFNEHKMISFLSVMPWKKMPYYTMSNFFVRAGAVKYFSIKNSGIPDLLTASVEHMESLNFYTFYYVRSDEKWPIKNKKRKNLGFDELCPEYKRYIVTVEEIIEKGEYPKYETHAWMISELPVLLKSIVIRYTLPNHLRHWGYNLHEF